LKTAGATIVIFLLCWIGYELVRIEHLLNKEKTPPQFEYSIITPFDTLFDMEMEGLGKEGWEIVSARRTVNSEYSQPKYELILKRDVTGRPKKQRLVSEPESPPPSAAPNTDEFKDEHQTLYVRMTKDISAKTSAGSIDLHVGEIVLVKARNDKSARIEVNGTTATIPISATDLAGQ
jgi:hypothetical protein